MSTLARLTAVFVLAGVKKATIGLDFKTTELPSGWTLPTLQDIADAGKDGWSGTPDLRAAFTAGIQMSHCEAFAYDLTADPTPPPAFQRTPTLGPVASDMTLQAGTHAGDISAFQVAVVSTFRTAIISRRGRGRVYLPPPPHSEVSGDMLLTATYDALLTGNFEDWVVGIQNAALVGTTITHHVVSLTAGNSNAVLSRSIRPRVDTQRRRLPKETGL